MSVAANFTPISGALGGSEAEKDGTRAGETLNLSFLTNSIHSVAASGTQDLATEWTEFNPGKRKGGRPPKSKDDQDIASTSKIGLNDPGASQDSQSMTQGLTSSDLKAKESMTSKQTDQKVTQWFADLDSGWSTDESDDEDEDADDLEERLNREVQAGNGENGDEDLGRGEEEEEEEAEEEEIGSDEDSDSDSDSDSDKNSNRAQTPTQPLQKTSDPKLPLRLNFERK